MISEKNKFIDILIKKYKFTDISDENINAISFEFYKNHPDIINWISENLDYCPIHIISDYDPVLYLTTVRVSCRFKNKEHATQFLLTHDIEA